MLVLLLALLVGCDALTVTPTSFIKLNDSSTDDLTGTPKFGNGAATASAYDDRTKFLYVIGRSRSWGGVGGVGEGWGWGWGGE